MLTGRRKGELTAAGIDRGWPHQVTVPHRLHRRATGNTASSARTSGGSSSALGTQSTPRNSAANLAMNDSTRRIEVAALAGRGVNKNGR